MLSLRSGGAVALSAAALAAGAVALPSSPAQAAGGCSGRLIVHKPLNAKGRKIGELNVYWNRATKRNCAIFSHAGRSWGKATRTDVSLMRCPRDRRAGQDCDSTRDADYRIDSGNYAYHAGPVSLRAPHRCIWAEGFMRWRGNYYWVQTRDGRKAAYCH